MKRVEHLFWTIWLWTYLGIMFVNLVIYYCFLFFRVSGMKCLGFASCNLQLVWFVFVMFQGLLTWVFECYTGNCTSTVCFAKNRFCCYPDSSRMWTILSSLLNFHQQISVQESRDVNSCHAVLWSNSGGTVTMHEWSWHVSHTVTVRIMSKYDRWCLSRLVISNLE